MGALRLNKVIIMTAVAGYVLGWGLYFITYVVAHWTGLDYFGYVAAEGAYKALIWPYMIYAWLRFDAPLI